MLTGETGERKCRLFLRILHRKEIDFYHVIAIFVWKLKNDVIFNKGIKR